jgi:acyl carrier protein
LLGSDALRAKVAVVMDQNGLIIDSDDLDSSLEVDSITFMSIIVGLEEEFGIVIPEGELVNIPQSYRQFIDMVLRIV